MTRAAEGTLYVVATPIGHLEDITLRALRTLGEVDLVLAEDTRRTRALLAHHGVSARCQSLHAHNEAARIAWTLAKLAAGGQVALVSDAGTPLVSDPGARLVSAARDAGHPVVPVPGASAVLAALAGCGLNVASFTFVGFLPRASGARRKQLRAHRDRAEALVLFESARRVRATLADLCAVFGDERRACIARELTKLHETFERGSLKSLLAAVEDASQAPKGEITLVIEGASQAEQSEAAAEQAEAGLDAAIERRVAEGMRPKAIAAELAEETGLPKREIYARAVGAADALEGAPPDGAPDESASAGEPGASGPTPGRSDA